MPENQPEKIKGVLNKIIYRSPDNNYFIGKMLSEEDNRTITIVGHTLEVQPGEALTVYGKWVTNSKYGKQFEIESIEILAPSTEAGIEKYLGSGLIKGIGPVMAKRVVAKFKLETLKILDNDAERLSEIDGFAEKRIELVKNEWKKQKYVREIMIFMQNYGISNNYAIKIYNIYKNESVNVLKSNPYRLIEDISGIGFKTADRIAENLGIEKDSEFRIKSGIIFLLNQLTGAGNCYYPLEDFIQEAMGLLECGETKLLESVRSLSDEGHIVIENTTSEGKIFLKSIYEDEVYASEKLIEIRDFKYNQKDDGPLKKSRDLFTAGLSSGIDKKIREISLAAGIELDEIQEEAVKKAATEKILIITGSPGTGKSTILNVAISYFEHLGKTVTIGAPTGRASKRLTEATGRDAKTIHRLLKYQPKINRFLKDEKNPINTDVLIIDEASMIDVRLFKSLLKAVKKSTSLVLVGDIDQLPAVGPGNILSDMIYSKSFSVVRLEHIYRQNGKSRIIYNAHLIRDGLYPVLSESEYKDFFFIDKTDPELVIETIEEMLIERIPKTFGYDPFFDIQVIVPTNKGSVGVESLNLRIQKKLNKNSLYVQRGIYEFRLGDRVIQLKNNYEKEVFNGDIGFVKKIDLEMKVLAVEFDKKLVEYDFYDLDQISLSYAITIHKSQGSEFKCVIIPILTSHYILLQRNLLYTALTRAKELAILIGSKKAIGIAVGKNIVEQRFTSLKERITYEKYM
jgi:exodeoxyribonuclease V alpha subunit